MAKLSKERIRKAIPGSIGTYAAIARKCNVSRSAITQFLQKEENQNLVEEINEEREKITDIVEEQLMKSIKKGNFRAIKFFLETKGKSRGYGKKQGIESNTKIVTDMEKFRQEVRDGTFK